MAPRSAMMTAWALAMKRDLSLRLAAGESPMRGMGRLMKTGGWPASWPAGARGGGAAGWGLRGGMGYSWCGRWTPGGIITYGFGSHASAKGKWLVRFVVNRRDEQAWSGRARRSEPLRGIGFVRE